MSNTNNVTSSFSYSCQVVNHPSSRRFWLQNWFTKTLFCLR